MIEKFKVRARIKRLIPRCASHKACSYKATLSLAKRVTDIRPPWDAEKSEFRTVRARARSTAFFVASHPGWVSAWRVHVLGAEKPSHAERMAQQRSSVHPRRVSLAGQKRIT